MNYSLSEKYVYENQSYILMDLSSKPIFYKFNKLIF